MWHSEGRVTRGRTCASWVRRVSLRVKGVGFSWVSRVCRGLQHVEKRLVYGVRIGNRKKVRIALSHSSLRRRVRRTELATRQTTEEKATTVPDRPRRAGDRRHSRARGDWRGNPSPLEKRRTCAGAATNHTPQQSKQLNAPYPCPQHTRPSVSQSSTHSRIARGVPRCCSVCVRPRNSHLMENMATPHRACPCPCCAHRHVSP
jgi:hypothetical protein